MERISYDIFYKTQNAKVLKQTARAVMVMIVWYWYWQLDLKLHIQSVPITTNGVSSNPAHGEVYSIQHYVIKFVSDSSLVGGFLWVLLFPPPLKLTTTIINITQILLKVALNTITLIITLKISGDYIRNKMKLLYI